MVANHLTTFGVSCSSTHARWFLDEIRTLSFALTRDGWPVTALCVSNCGFHFHEIWIVFVSLFNPKSRSNYNPRCCWSSKFQKKLIRPAEISVSKSVLQWLAVELNCWKTKNGQQALASLLRRKKGTNSRKHTNTHTPKWRSQRVLKVFGQERARFFLLHSITL